MTPTRVSTRKKQRTQYNVDPYQDLDLSDSSETTPENGTGSGHAQPRPSATRGRGRGRFSRKVQDSDSDTYAPPAESAEEDDNEVDSGAEFRSSEEESPERSPEPEPSDVSEVEEEEDQTPGAGRLIKKPIKASFQRAAALRGEGRKESDKRRLGVDFNQRETRMLAFFGSDEQVLKAVQKARDKWTDDATLPSRTADSNGFGGFAPSPFFLRAQREKDPIFDWAWYDSSAGAERIALSQEILPIPADIALEYCYPLSGSSTKIDILAGPLSSQILATLAPKASLNMVCFWQPPQDAAGQDQEQRDFGPLGKDAWLINVGAPVTSLQWLANQKGDHQYLSVVTQLNQKDKQDHQTPPAFTKAPGPASIQIWRFAVCNKGSNIYRPDYNTPPKLAAVLCADWGVIRALKWCPFIRNSADRDDPRHLGLLGVVFGDGFVRIFDITLPKSSLSTEETTAYLNLSKPIFECCPPETLCTTLDWLSSSVIASGHANGYLSVWDISDPNTTRPFFYHRLHTSYITATVSLAPSRPHILATASVDGHTRITDIHAPQVDTVSSNRVLLLPTWLVWSDNCQSVIASHNRNFLDFIPVRSFGVLFRLYRHKAVIQHVALSPNHASMLSCDACGEVMISNPVRKVYYPKREIKTIVQTWFVHEASSKNDKDVRFIEGILAEEGQAIKIVGTKRDPKAAKGEVEGGEAEGGGGRGGAAASSSSKGKKDITDRDNYYVFAEKSSVTQLAWNPNMKVSGWAAAGTQSGLVRVQDLAV